MASQYTKLCFALLTILLIPGVRTGAAAQTPESRLCASFLSSNSPAKAFQQAYFLPNTFSDFEVEWYSKHLSAMKEPALSAVRNCKIESYRFLWLRTFDRPIAIRLWQAGGQRYLAVKKLSGKGGYEPGRVVVSRRRVLTEEEWNAFKGYLNRISYWGLPTEEEAKVNPDGTINVTEDGARWILEGVTGNSYHVVDRQGAKGLYRESCLYLLRLSGLKVRKKDIY